VRASRDTCFWDTEMLLCGNGNIAAVVYIDGGCGGGGVQFIEFLPDGVVNLGVYLTNGIAIRTSGIFFIGVSAEVSSLPVNTNRCLIRLRVFVVVDRHSRILAATWDAVILGNDAVALTCAEIREFQVFEQVVIAVVVLVVHVHATSRSHVVINELDQLVEIHRFTGCHIVPAKIPTALVVPDPAVVADAINETHIHGTEPTRAIAYGY
jgi:hypothetical protein